MFFAGGWSLKLAQRWNWIQMNDDRLSLIFFGGLLIIFAVISLLWCRSIASYRAWRETNPSVFGRLFNSISFRKPNPEGKFALTVASTLLGGPIFCVVGMYLLVRAFK